MGQDQTNRWQINGKMTIMQQKVDMVKAISTFYYE